MSVFIFKIIYWIYIKPKMLVWSLNCRFHPFRRFKAGQVIYLKGKKYLIKSIEYDKGGPVYSTKPLDSAYPSEYRPFCYYADKEGVSK